MEEEGGEEFEEELEGNTSQLQANVSIVNVSQDRKEIGHLGVWSVSSFKPGFGVEKLYDGNTETYWQSDGPGPHLVNIQFPKKVLVEEVMIYSDYNQDESYTPNKVAVRAGTNYHDLQEVQVIEFPEPHGWISIPVSAVDAGPLKTHFIQLRIISNFQSGRDTHLRLVKVFGPISKPNDLNNDSYSSLEFDMHSVIR